RFLNFWITAILRGPTRDDRTIGYNCYRLKNEASRSGPDTQDRKQQGGEAPQVYPDLPVPGSIHRFCRQADGSYAARVGRVRRKVAMRVPIVWVFGSHGPPFGFLMQRVRFIG